MLVITISHVSSQAENKAFSRVSVFTEWQFYLMVTCTSVNSLDVDDDLNQVHTPEWMSNDRRTKPVRHLSGPFITVQ
jgi:hypothetical protein